MSPACSPQSSTRLPQLQSALPPQSLYGNTQQSGTGWLLSPEPYALTAEQYDLIQALGPALLAFNQALENLYTLSLKDASLAWVMALFNAGKPPALLQFSQMKRFKKLSPLVLRPDLLVTESGLALTEIDSVPGGLGFTAALQKAYTQAGASVVQAQQGLPLAFTAMLKTLSTEARPTIAIIVSDEADDYRTELTYLASQIPQDEVNAVVLHPKSIVLERNQLGYLNPQEQFCPIHIVYRFFELFDLPNIPQIELIQYAVKKGLVACTPPFKPHLEEKLCLGLFHHPQLQTYWQTHLNTEQWQVLRQVIPETWILDSTPIPPHAAIQPALQFGSQLCHQFDDLQHLTQKQRELVLKPSGFSPLAWGSRGVTIGHDVPQTQWSEVLHTALTQFTQSPWILQRYHNTAVQPYCYFDTTGNVVESEGRTRLCPYYFVQGDTTELAGILATTCPKDKKMIHGMRDGVLRPASYPA